MVHVLYQQHFNSVLTKGRYKDIDSFNELELHPYQTNGPQFNIKTSAILILSDTKLSAVKFLPLPGASKYKSILDK